MAYRNNLVFNQRPSSIMHIDLNSCFATIEQQANPLLRGKPIAVAAYITPSGCIVAPSIEAKALGIKVGMRVRDGKLIYPDLIVLPPDPWKYRDVHLKLRSLLLLYTNEVVPKSIDEFTLNFEGYPSFDRGLIKTAEEIKQKIKDQIGEWLTVSIGIGPNRFLAKTASGLKKPDGLDEINVNNFLNVYNRLTLPDLHGINMRLTARLNSVGVYSVVDFYKADINILQSAFRSISGYYWYLRLRGWEIDDVDFSRKSFGNMHTLSQPLNSLDKIAPILSELVQKVGRRLRKGGFVSQGIHLGLLYENHSYWHQGRKTRKEIFDSKDIYKEAFYLLCKASLRHPVRKIAVSCFNLRRNSSVQLNIFENVNKKKSLVEALDKINDRWGEFVITPARMLGNSSIPDSIGFGSIKELERFIHKEADF
jgi:DNA polymerase-4